MRRAPGPGAIKKVDWAPKANYYLKGRRIVLHTDRAKTYGMRVEGLVHDSVRHSKKRVKVNGKWCWKKPVWVRLVTHKLPDGKTVRTKAGTQVIDRVWRLIRSHLQGKNGKPGSDIMERAVRGAQWLYWNRGKDLWVETGKMLKANRAARRR